MKAPWIGVIAFAGVGLAVSPVHAEQQVKIETMALTIGIPDDWLHSVDESTDVFTTGGGFVIVGQISMLPVPCADQLATIQERNPGATPGELVEPVPKWTGVQYRPEDGGLTVYCRAFEGSVAHRQVIIVGNMGDGSTLTQLVRAFSTAVDADAETTYEIQLTTLGLKIQVPTNWKELYNDGFSSVVRAGGPSFDAQHAWTSNTTDLLIAKVAASWNVNCAEEIARLKESGGAPVEPLPGWSGVEVDGMGAYCHEGTRAYVRVDTAVASWFLAAIDAGLERRRVSAIPTPFEKFGPNRFELGLGRFDADPNDLSVEEGWGLALAAGKTPWRTKPGLTWSYQARLTATGEGSPMTVEGGIGVNLKLIALQGIVGFGAAGDPAPLGVHAGAQFDLLFLKAPGGGFDFTVSHVWRDGGTSTRLGGAFLLAGSRRAYALSFGWESPLDTSLFTFNLMMMGLPPSE